MSTGNNPQGGKLRPLADTTFDVLVIGGGIHGATLAAAAARRGMKVALVEKGDFGGAASANSLKILHGGLRYLQQMNLPRMRESIAARREGLTELPHLVQPATFLAPTGSGFKRSRPAYHVAAWLNDLISCDRNRGVTPSRCLPKTNVLNADAFTSLVGNSGLQADGGLLWGDGFVENTERYTLAYVMSAAKAGAVVLNYTAAEGFLRQANTIEGARVRDVDTGETVEVRARMTVLTTGGWLGELLPESAPPAGPRVRACNIVVNRQWFGPLGVGLDGHLDSGTAGKASRRNFFFAPWKTGTIIGTIYDPFDDSTDQCQLTSGEIERFVSDVNGIFPDAALSPEDVTFAHVGILPAKPHAIHEPSGTTRVLDLEKEAGIAGCMALLGVKYTTAAIWAQRLGTDLARRLNIVARPAEPPLYGGGAIVEPAALQQRATGSGWSLELSMARWLAREFGTTAEGVVDRATTKPELRQPLPETAVPLAAVSYAAVCEQARHLEDVIFRRTDLGSFAYPGNTALHAAASTMATELGWEDATIKTEIARVRQAYQRLGIPV